MQEKNLENLVDQDLVLKFYLGEINKNEMIQEVIRRYQREIFVCYIMRSENDASYHDDIFQLWCVSIMKGIHTLREDSNLRCWLITLATNSKKRFFRKKSHQVEKNFEDGSEFENICNQYGLNIVKTPSQIYHKKENQESFVINEVLSVLNEQEKEIVLLHLWGGLDYKEIAQILYQDDSKSNRVAQKYKRLKPKLQKKSKEMNLEPSDFLI